MTLLLFVVTSVVGDAALSGLSLSTQRWIILVTLIFPAGLGVLLGIMELRQPHHHVVAASVAILLNALVAIFFLGVLAIAG